jgi:uncharacterized protein (DUF1800 family)
LADAALHRAAFSKRQLKERMVEFWTDHFNILWDKVQTLKVKDDGKSSAPTPREVSRHAARVGAKRCNAAVPRPEHQPQAHAEPELRP